MASKASAFPSGDGFLAAKALAMTGPGPLAEGQGDLFELDGVTFSVPGRVLLAADIVAAEAARDRADRP